MKLHDRLFQENEGHPPTQQSCFIDERQYAGVSCLQMYNNNLDKREEHMMMEGLSGREENNKSKCNRFSRPTTASDSTLTCTSTPTQLSLVSDKLLFFDDDTLY